LKNILLITIAIFALLALFFGLNAHGARSNDIRQNDFIERSVVLAEARLPQAEAFFFENRHHIELLAQSPELHAREVTILPNILISVTDETFWSVWEWHEIPWLTYDLIEAIFALLYTEEQGANHLSIIFYNGAMHYTLFATPLHAILHGNQQHAWVAICYGDAFPWEARTTVHTEPLDSGFYLSITSFIHRNEALPFILLTALFIVLTIATSVVLIWCVRTYKILFEADNTIRTILLMAFVIIIGLVLVNYGLRLMGV